MHRAAFILELEVLDLLARSGDGIGCGALLLQLLDRGVSSSQPTIGRLLTQLDHRGLTAKLSNKGRVLTEQGRRRLCELRRGHERSRWVDQLMTTINVATLTDLRDVLVARRALEGEIARLSALHASPHSITEMRSVLAAQQSELHAESHGADQALEFHLMLASAAGNRFLAIAANLIRNDRQSLDAIMYHLGSTVGGESYSHHVEILDAVAAREATAAQEAMIRHMDQYIRYVDSLQMIDKHPPSGEGFINIRRVPLTNADDDKEEAR